MSSLQDLYVRIDGISGESKDSKHSGWIDALTIGYGVSQSFSGFTGGGGGVGKANFDSLTFTHYLDKSTPNLMQFCAAGKHIPNVEVSCCKVGDGSQEYVRITLNECLITSAGPRGASSDIRLKESVSIAYAKIKVEVKEQKPDGSMGPAVTGTWDVKQNKL